MKKILLIYEDYAECSKTQTYLKKVGFDVLSQNNDQRISDQIISFNPDLIVAYGLQKFTSMNIGVKLKDIAHYKGRTFLVLPKGDRPNPQDIPRARVDVLIEAPIVPERLIQLISKTLQMDTNQLIEKYKKTAGDDKSNRLQHVKESGPREKINFRDKTRAEKYQHFVEEAHIDKKVSTHSRQAIKDRQTELKRGWNFNFLGEIDKLKKQFVAALFRKK
jgi:hypothetical protein